MCYRAKYNFTATLVKKKKKEKKKKALDVTSKLKGFLATQKSCVRSIKHLHLIQLRVLDSAGKGNE